MDIERSQQLEQIILLSKDMLAKAGDQEWGLVAEIEARRRELVMRCFQQPAKQQDAPDVAAAIQEILRLNQQITELGKRCQDQLGSDIHTNKLGRTASAAYLGCAPGNVPGR
ncbi:MAG: flagellar protein FliT [Pseudomonadota bacterium]|nr:flagellar protein FliT [Pseudomonadota bacterium]